MTIDIKEHKNGKVEVGLSEKYVELLEIYKKEFELDSLEEAFNHLIREYIERFNQCPFCKSMEKPKEELTDGGLFKNVICSECNTIISTITTMEEI